MARRIAVALQKGGVGKTSMTVNLAAALAIVEGLRVVVVDMDPQRNATAALLGPAERSPTIEHVLRGEVALADALVQCHDPNLHVLPGSRMLVAMERRGDDAVWARSVFGVRDLLRDSVPADVDVVLIDTPPGGGLWLQAALAAAQGYLVVAWPDGFSADGIRDLLDTVDAIRERYNPQLQLDGLIINHNRNTSGHKAYVGVLEEIYGDAVLQPIMPVRSVIADARDQAMPVEVYERTYRTGGDAAEKFRSLAAALVRRTGLRSGHMGKGRR